MVFSDISYFALASATNNTSHVHNLHILFMVEKHTNMVVWSILYESEKISGFMYTKIKLIVPSPDKWKATICMVLQHAVVIYGFICVIVEILESMLKNAIGEMTIASHRIWCSLYQANTQIRIQLSLMVSTWKTSITKRKYLRYYIIWLYTKFQEDLQQVGVLTCYFY